MIRLLLLIFLPLLTPFVVWYLWQVFGKKPLLDPVTGEQVPPEVEKAPLAKLGIAGALLMALTVGMFLLFHERFSSEPYQPISVDEYERQQKRDATRP
tara:strand:+ start:645 stop:938 length:294 start_codon:yes stop_codon:yes gene_type:complete